MLKLALAGLLSVALIHFAPLQTINNPEPKAATPPTAGQRHSAILTAKQSEPVITTPAVAEAKVQELNNGCSQYRSLVEQYDWNVQTAMAICMAESGGNERAFSPTCDRGLMQVNCIHADMVSGNLDVLFDPATNISVAYKIYSARGWSAWSTYLSGVYLKYE